MKFEWDDVKSEVNATKHGIDFATATRLWQDADRIEIETPYPVEKGQLLSASSTKSFGLLLQHNEGTQRGSFP